MLACPVVPAKLAAPEEIYVDRDHAVLWFPPLLVQVRRGPMTRRALDAIDRGLRERRGRSLRPGARVAAVPYLEDAAPVMNDDLRAEQRRVVHAMLEGLDVRLAPVIGGHGVSAMLQRTLVRGISFADRRVRVASSAEEAAAWVAPHLDVPAAEVVEAVKLARERR